MGILTTFLPQLALNVGGQFLANWASSAGHALGSSLQFGSNSSANYQQSGQSSAMSQSGGSASSYGQQGSVAGIAGLGQTALGTPTGNNATSAAGFNAASAATANNLQTGQWSLANLMNMGSNVFWNLANIASQASAQGYNRESVKLSQAWQQMMRQTAYQDTMKDMKAAGLNPILAASNGATATPNSGTASTSAMKFQGTQAASIPAAKTATMQAMYDYGNNTAQWLDNMMSVVSNAKQMGWNQEASWLQQAASQGAWSSAKAIEETAKAGSTAETTTSTSKGGQAGAHIDVDAGFGGGSKTQKGVNF